MTKERRLAIQMWEEIAQRDPDSVNLYKKDFCCKHDLDWKNDCWFCQYVRQDYREDLPSREDISTKYNGCQKCPIYKYGRCTGDKCGCASMFKTNLFIQVIHAIEADERREAAEIIVRLLKGEKPWVTGEE